MTASRALVLAAATALTVIGSSPAVFAADNRADLSVKSDMRSLANVMETYYTDHQEYPGAEVVTYDGRRTVVIGDSTTRLAKRNRLGTIRLTEDREAYCVRVVRSATATDTTQPWSFVSDAGGMVQGRCPNRYVIVAE